jgi:SAM-dependent methyltransferase
MPAKPHFPAKHRLDAHLDALPQMLQYQALARDLARRAPRRVLDWGCGFGQMSALLREEGVDVVPFDYRPELEAPTVRSLERYAGLEAHLSPDPVLLPFEDDSFDTVLSCGVLEHVENPDASLEELRRVLRPHGLLYVTNLPNRFSYTEKIARLLGRYYHGSLPNDRVYTKRSAQGLLNTHGFDVKEFRRVHMLPLVLGGPALVWKVSCALERVPGLNMAATSLELVAVSRD